mgnify:CR=1 FL=1
MLIISKKNVSLLVFSSLTRTVFSFLSNLISSSIIDVRASLGMSDGVMIQGGLHRSSFEGMASEFISMTIAWSSLCLFACGSGHWSSIGGWAAASHVPGGKCTFACSSSLARHSFFLFLAYLSLFHSFLHSIALWILTMSLHVLWPQSSVEEQAQAVAGAKIDFETLLNSTLFELSNLYFNAPTTFVL